MLGCMPRQALLTRVADNQFGAFFCGLLHISRSNRMVDRWIGTNDHDEFGVLGSGKRRRNSAGTNTFHQCRDRAGMAKASTMIDVVGFKSGADQFLKQIGFFV